jgi:cellulose synthase/poly-beta-1,6-N-acetylglucosamine synthase-like glycosyltransferase
MERVGALVESDRRLLAWTVQAEYGNSRIRLYDIAADRQTAVRAAWCTRGSRARVGVVVANWNRKELLRACLDSLAVQTHGSFEVVVVDNGSTDGSSTLVEEIAKSFPAPP